MARVYKKPLYRPVPNGAKIITDEEGKKYAYWINEGNEYTAEYVESKNGPRIVEESEYYIARYTDATGRFRERSTGCRDLRAAEHKLNTWLQEIEKVKAGILSQEEFEISKRINDAIEVRLIDFKEHLMAKGATSHYIGSALSRIRKVCEACKFKKMLEMNSTVFIRWLNKNGANGMGARTRNSYRESMVAFANWAVVNNCIAINPFQKIPKAQESSDRRRERRALAPSEIVTLLNAAEERPLHDQLAVGSRKASPSKKPAPDGRLAKISDATREKAMRLGLERKLLYATMIYTGLRKNELASIRIGQVFLDHDIPHIILAAKDEKSRRGATIPLHPELVVHLKAWLALKKQRGEDGQKEKLFHIPAALCKILNRDLAFAGIPKRDVLDRVIDVHALRHTHGTLLAQSGVSPTVAKSSMRHSDVRMTMNVYTHLELGNVADGVNRLPDFLNSEKKDGDETK